MQNQIDELKEKRLELVDVNEQINQLESELFESKLGQALHKVEHYQKTIKEEIIGIENNIREDAINHYMKTGNKKLATGISVIINKTVNYSEVDAISWAIDNKLVHTVLKLNKVKFEKHAKSVNDTIPLGFVTIGNIPSVRIAKKSLGPNVSITINT